MSKVKAMKTKTTDFVKGHVKGFVIGIVTVLLSLVTFGLFKLKK